MATSSNTLQDMSFFLIRSLDAKKLIERIEPSQQGGVIHYKNGQTLPLNVATVLSASLFCEGYVVIRNARENVQTVIDNWQEALKFEKLVFLFIDEKTGNKWLLRPHIHAKVAEPKTLAQGLITLFEHSIGKA